LKPYRTYIGSCTTEDITRPESGPSGTARRRRRPQNPDATRQALLDAALRLFSERGFHGATVKAIAQEAGVTKGAFYHHFESKEDVLRQIHAEYAGQMALDARDVAEQTEDPPGVQLRTLIERAVIALGSHREHVAVYYQENRFLSERSYTSIRRLHEEQSNIVLDIITRGKAAGEIRSDIEPKILLVSISGITAWIYQWYQPGGPLALEQIAASLSQVILDPVIKEPGV
jgi:AcrR family transcriptional regulator